MRFTSVALVATVVSLACFVEAAPARAQDEGAAAARKIVLDYKAGEAFPLRIFEGVDFLEPLLPFVAAERGDWGRLLFDTAVPYGLIASAFIIRPTDSSTLREVRRWNWAGIDRKQDNLPTMAGLIAVGAASLFLPAPEDGEGYSWGLRADRMAVFALGMLTTELETEIMKPLMRRRRPDGSDNLSRPSGHASTVAAAMSFTADVLRDTFRPQDEPSLFVRFWKELACGLPYLGVGYICLERVHGSKHYLSDTLLGAGIGALTMHMFYAWSFTRTEQGGSWLQMASVGYNADQKGIEFAIRGEF